MAMWVNTKKFICAVIARARCARDMERKEDLSKYPMRGC
jgi:hypothetical protein